MPPYDPREGHPKKSAWSATDQGARVLVAHPPLPDPRDAEITQLRAFVRRVAALELWTDTYPDATTPPRMHHDLPDEWIGEARTLLAHPR